MTETTAVRILLVEDDSEDAEIFRRYAAQLQTHRIEVDHVELPDDALRLVSWRGG